MGETVDVTKNYKMLAAAIIKCAIRDYESARKKNDRHIIESVKKFFYSQWFTQLAKSDGPRMFKQIEENFDKYGKCMPFENEKTKEDWGE